VSQVAIDVFMAAKNRKENLVPTILADTYEAFDLCYERRAKMLACSLPMLYVWIMAGIGEKRMGVKCPIDLVRQLLFLTI